MAYGLKYELLCRSRKGKNGRLDISFDGYAGAQIDRDMPGGSPLVLVKDKADVVRGTSVEYAIREVIDFEMDVFYTNNGKKILVEFYEENVLAWKGYNLPNKYQALYIPAPVGIHFIASDGLGLLKSEDFNLTGRHSQLEILIYCLDKIGLGLGFSISINLREQDMDTSRSVLAQAYEDAESYGDRKCYTVIEKLLDKYDAEITQINARWHITASDSKTEDRMLYTSAGVYEGLEDAPVWLELSMDADKIKPVGTLSRDMRPGGKKITLTHDYGLKESLLVNYEFWKYKLHEFTAWNRLNTALGMSQRIIDGKAYMFLQGHSGSSDEKLSQIIALKSGSRFVFEISYAALGYYLDADQLMKYVHMTVTIGIWITDGTSIFYLKDYGNNNYAWTEDESKIILQTEAQWSIPVFQKASLSMFDLPIDGDLHVDLYWKKAIDSSDAFWSEYQSMLSLYPGGYLMTTGVLFGKAIVMLTSDSGIVPSKLQIKATFENNTEPDDLGEFEMINGDAPQWTNNDIVYQNITSNESGVPTIGWIKGGESSVLLLAVQLIRKIASKNRRARQVLQGTIKGDGIMANSLIRHPYNNNTLFEIEECQRDFVQDRWNVKLIELLSWSNESITFESDGDSEVEVPEPAEVYLLMIYSEGITIEAGQDFDVMYIIENVGASNGGTRIDWEVRTEDGITVVLSGSFASDVIPPNEEVTCTVTFTHTIANPGAGNYILYFKDEHDNEYSVIMTVEAAAEIQFLLQADYPESIVPISALPVNLAESSFSATASNENGDNMDYGLVKLPVVASYTVTPNNSWIHYSVWNVENNTKITNPNLYTDETIIRIWCDTNVSTSPRSGSFTISANGPYGVITLNVGVNQAGQDAPISPYINAQNTNHPTPPSGYTAIWPAVSFSASPVCSFGSRIDLAENASTYDFYVVAKAVYGSGQRVVALDSVDIVLTIDGVRHVIASGVSISQSTGYHCTGTMDGEVGVITFENGTIQSVPAYTQCY